MKRLFKKSRTLSASSLLLTSLFLCLFLSVGCSVIKNNAAETPNVFVNEKKDNNAEEDVMEKVSSDKISIVCTTFPQYDWVKNIIGNQEMRFDITLLLDNGVDMHSYQPTIRDIAIAGSGDLFIYVGGESDAWVRDALKEAKNKDLKVINLMDVLGNSVKEEEVVEGMQEGKGFWGHSHKEGEEAFASHTNNREFGWPDCGIDQIEYSKERSGYTGNEFFAIRYKRTAFRRNHIFKSNA